VKSLEFFKSTLATMLAIVLAWLLSVRPAQAGYTVTLRQVGPDVVATGSGAIDLHGLTFSGGSGLGAYYTGHTIEPTSFGRFPLSSSVITVISGKFAYIATTGTHEFVLRVPGYVSGTALSGSLTYGGASLATLGVTPGTYVWTWGTGANQNFTLQIKTPGPASTAIWYLNNNAFVAGTYAPTLPAGWIVIGVADFNGDSQPDYLLCNTSTHQTAVWYLNNNVFIGGAFGPTLPANWNVVGVADFDGDGRPDYLLFNSTSQQTAIWYLSGTTFVRGAFGPSLPNGWDLVAVGDFNADGKPDYVLYNAFTHQTAIWYLNNNAFISGVFGPTLPVNWRVVGVADFNGDNKPDYLLYNASTRQTAIWYLSGPTLVGGAYGPTIVSGYTLIGAADFNADGKPDYVLYGASVQ
jgi:FG-GAP-like repeat